eukprot:scaffold28973_cov118-Isochrysis_galbana.AAC.6
MTKHRIDYVSTNLRPASQYVVMGKTGAVAPVAVSQGERLSSLGEWEAGVRRLTLPAHARRRARARLDDCAGGWDHRSRVHQEGVEAGVR